MQTKELGGRKFQVITSGPINHDIHIQRLIRQAGIDHLTLEAEETKEAFVDRIIGAVYDSGHMLELIGSMLAPAELDLKDWTPKIADEVAEFLGMLTAKEDKEAFRGLIVNMLLGFFQSGLVSFWISRTSSPKSSGAEAAEPESPKANASPVGA